MTTSFHHSRCRFLPALTGLILATTFVAEKNCYGGFVNVILADNPVAYYRFNETSGTLVTDSSGNGFDGAYRNGVEWHKVSHKMGVLSSL
jgi:hypothetical protein